MTVFEAVDRAGYMKIAGFIAGQPPENRCFQSWNVGHPASTAGFLKHCKETRENFHIFWCEDQFSRVRAVYSIEAHDTLQNWSIATNAYAMVDNVDLAAGDMTYYRELVDYLIRHEAPKYRAELGEFWVAEHLITWVVTVFAGCHEIKREATFKGFRVWFLVVDFKKYLELNP